MARKSQDQILSEEFAAEAFAQFLQDLDAIPDPRRLQGKRYPLNAILLIALMAVICNFDSAIAFERFGQRHEERLKRYFSLPHGVPTQDVYLRVFALLDNTIIETLFRQWVPIYAKIAGVPLDDTHIAIDGKTSRHSFETGEIQGVHTLEALAVHSGLMLCALDCDKKKSNEITVIPKILDLLDLQSSTVTIDAVGTYPKIAQQIIDKKGDYVLTVKGNQKKLFKEAQDLFENQKDSLDRSDPFVYDRTIDKGHGRIEERECFVIRDVKDIETKSLWPKLSYIAVVHRKVTHLNPKQYQQEETTETQYYIGSHQSITASQVSALIREHWLIESAHWVLDMVFNEDAARMLTKNCAKNMAILRRLALNLVKADQSHPKDSIHIRRLLAATDIDYVISLLGINEI